MKRPTTISLFAAALAVSLTLTTSLNRAFATGITAGNLVVVQFGDGSAALSGSSTATFLKEFQATGGPAVQTIAMPTAASGSNNPLTNSGTATSEGFITLSTDGTFLTMAGYGVGTGTATPQSSAPDVVPRVLGRIDVPTGAIDTSNKFSTPNSPGPSDAFSGSNPRSAVATNSGNAWMAGNAGSGQGASAGVRYVTSSTSSVRVDTTSSNMRVVNVFNGQLYTSSSTGTLLGVSTVGSGLPTAASGSTITALPGMPTTGTHSAYDFVFKDANTLYIADDGGATTGGGIQKWTFDGTNWNLQYTLLNNGTSTTAVRGLAGYVDPGSGNEVLFATNSTTLLTITDTGAGATPTTLETAPTNTNFRGVEYVPVAVPEPASVLLGGMALAGFVVIARRRRA